MKNTITQAYIEAALWSSTDDNGEPLDNGEYELSPETVKQMEADCDDFLALLEREGVDWSDWNEEQFGHDFWLTRNGHGAGFWDRGLDAGEVLTKWAKSYGESDLYVGDDGMIYAS